jgi:hypothetical protein
MGGMDAEAPAPEAPQPPGRRWRWPRTTRSGRATAAGAVVAALAIAGIGVAAAQSGSSSTSTPTTVPNPAPRFDMPGMPGKPFGRHRFGGPGPGPGLGLGSGALHGEFVTRNGTSGFRTVDVQTGQVTEVSTTAITVKSDDGFSKTYAVDTNTLVDAGRDGIGTVKKGDTVNLTAVVTDGKATAMNVNDMTTLGSIRQHWMPAGASPTA